VPGNHLRGVGEKILCICRLLKEEVVPLFLQVFDINPPIYPCEEKMLAASLYAFSLNKLISTCSINAIIGYAQIRSAILNISNIWFSPRLVANHRMREYDSPISTRWGGIQPRRVITYVH
jgi:hypothetical protein